MTRVRLLSLVALLAVAAVLSGCGAGAPAAAKVSGREISRDDLNRDLRAIIDNKPLRRTPSIQVASTPKGTVNSGITASWLTGLVRQVVIDREFARRRLTVTPAARASAAANLEQQQFGPEIFGGFSKSFRDRLIDREARLEALYASLPGAQQQGNTAAAQEFGRLIEDGIRRGHVHVDPRYGKSAFTAQGFQITPPAAPQVREKPASSTTAGQPAG
jgi:hypothetical protein